MPAKITADYHQDLTDGITIYMNKVEIGSFLMGNSKEGARLNEKPVRRVHIAKPFYIGLFPVTQVIWEAVMKGHNPSFT